MGLFSYLKSTILSKIVMAGTGVILVLFIFGHMAGNLQIFIGREAFNTYAHFLQSLGELLWLIRIFLLICLVLHIVTAIRLYFLNISTKPAKYQVKAYVNSTLSSRTMIYGGIAIFLFLVYHLLHFTAGVAEPSIYGHIERYGPLGIFERHDAYYMVVAGFRSVPISLIYIVGVIFLALHLNHSVQSMFQTLGISGPRFTPWMINCSRSFAIFIATGYILIPLTIMLGIVGGGV